MEVVINVVWNAEFSNHEDVLARRDIFTTKVREEEEERCTPKMERSETSKDNQYRYMCKIERKNRLWKKYSLTKLDSCGTVR